MIIDFEFDGKMHSVDDEKLKGYDLIKGHKLYYRRRLFSGSYKRPKYCGYEDYIVEIISESYGINTGQHTFTLKVLMVLDKTNGKNAGDKIRVKGRNLYPNCVILTEPDDEQERRSEKHDRAIYSKPGKGIYINHYDDCNGFNGY